MKYSKLLILIFFAFILFSGVKCKKDDPITVYLDKEFLSYFAFPLGSWWVYEEINTGEKDSAYVIKYGTILIESEKQRSRGYNYEKLYYHLVIMSDTVNGTAFAKKKIDDINYKYTYNEVRSINPSIPMLFYPCSLGESSGADYGTYILSIGDYLLTDSTNYKNTITTKFDSSQYANPIKSETYCKNIGIIRRELFDERIFELKKYYINN